MADAQSGNNPGMIGADEAAAFCGVSRTHWYRMVCSGKTPASVKLGRRVLWRMDELEKWVACGCPPRMKWEKMRQ